MPNIVNLPNDIYSGGSTILNPQPYVNYIIQQQQRQQAKKEAVDNYYRDLSKTLTPAGMAGNDVESFVNKVNSWKDFVTQNRNVLNNPNDKNYANVVNQESHLYNDALQHSAISKQKVAELSKANDIRLQHPDYDFTDAATLALHNASLPIDKGYQPLDQSALGYNPKSLEANDYNDFNKAIWGNLKQTPGKPSIEVLPDKKTKIISTIEDYTPEALTVATNNAETMYNQHGKFYRFINSLGTPDNYDKYNQIFKQYYGQDLDMKHPEEMAAAYALASKTPANKTQQTPNFSPTNIKINLGDQAAPSLDNYISQLQQSSKQNPITFVLRGKQSYNYEIPSSPELSNAFAAKVGSSTIYPDQVQFDSNGNFIPIFYKYIQDPANPKNSIKVINKDGRAIVDEALTHPVSAQEGRIRLAKEMFGEKGLMNVMKTSPQQQTALPQSQNGYSNITETNKGTIGIKNGKWYDIKTGKPVE